MSMHFQRYTGPVEGWKCREPYGAASYACGSLYDANKDRKVLNGVHMWQRRLRVADASTSKRKCLCVCTCVCKK